MPVVAFYEKGPAWTDGAVFRDQPHMPEHIAFLDRLAQRDQVSGAGPFHGRDELVEGSLVGMVVFTTGDLPAARRLADEDPAVTTGMMTFTLRPWFV